MRTPEDINQQLQYVCNAYTVPAEYGRRILFKGKPGTIVDAHNAYIGVRLDETPESVNFYHPTWEIEYLEEIQLPVVVKGISKKKLERKERYREYLRLSECFDSFFDYIRYIEHRRKNGLIE